MRRTLFVLPIVVEGDEGLTLAWRYSWDMLNGGWTDAHHMVYFAGRWHRR